MLQSLYVMVSIPEAKIENVFESPIILGVFDSKEAAQNAWKARTSEFKDIKATPRIFSKYCHLSPEQRGWEITLEEGVKPTNGGSYNKGGRGGYNRGGKSGGRNQAPRVDAPTRAPRTDAGAEKVSLYGKIN